LGQATFYFFIFLKGGGQTAFLFFIKKTVDLQRTEKKKKENLQDGERN
jgi:hypothetical protein